MFEYEDIKINYKEFGKKDGNAILYLHGWGQNIEMMEPIAKPFAKKFRLLILDLPGFGKSDEPKEVWSLDDYVEMIHSFLEEMNVKNPIVIGHSFGGKLAIIYASKYEVSKLVLLASPFEVKIKEESKKLKFLKKLKNVPVLNKVADVAKKYMGSVDYRNASKIMRDILVKHVNTDAVENAKKIKCPTLIIWGTRDEAVPYEDGKTLNSLIKDSGLVTYEGCSHYAYLERLNQTLRVLDVFMK